MGASVGDRVAAVISCKGKSVYWLGEGVYEGNFIAPGTHLLTIEEAREFAKEGGNGDISDEDLKKHVDGFNESPMVKNPRIKLDNGSVAWGRECWWGDIAGCKKQYEGMTFVNVKIERDEQGHFKSLVGEDGKEIPLDEV